MARERMVTRTIVSYEVECITMDIETMETAIKNYALTGDISNKEKVLKTLKKLYESEESTEKIVAIREVIEHEEMYGMPEVDFIRIAKRLDPETRKPLEAKK